MDFTDYGAEQTLRWVLGEGPQAPPTEFFVALHIGDPGVDGVANPAGETLRVEYIPNPIDATGGGTGEAFVLNNGDINWVGLSDTETISHVSIWDAVTGGNAWYKGQLVSPVPVVAGGNFQFLDENGQIKHD